MSWTPKSANDMAFYKEADITLPSSATTEYSSAIDFVGPDHGSEKRWVTFRATPSAVSGTNLDIALYGAESEDGTKTLLKDAIIADLTDNSAVAGVVDLNAYPAPYYFIGHTSDADESANTITYEIFFTPPGN